MKKLAVLVCGLVAACNYDTGECYLREEEGAGAGGHIVPTGAGGFGDVPPEPQDTADPAAGCAPDRSCTDMYVDCREKGSSCNRQIDVGKTLCEFCRDDCASKRPYKYTECYSCGFE